MDVIKKTKSIVQAGTLNPSDCFRFENELFTVVSMDPEEAPAPELVEDLASHVGKHFIVAFSLETNYIDNVNRQADVEVVKLEVRESIIQ